MFTQGAAQQWHQVGKGGCQIDLRRGQWLLAGKRQQLTGQRATALRRPQSTLDVSGQGMLRVQLHPRELQIAHDHSQQIVEIMSNAAGQLADRLHLLGFTEHRFRLCPLGHVGDGQNEAIVGRRGSADLQLTAIRPQPLIHNRFQAGLLAVNDLLLAFKKRTMLGRQMVGERRIGGFLAHHRAR